MKSVNDLILDKKGGDLPKAILMAMLGARAAARGVAHLAPVPPATLAWMDTGDESIFKEAKEAHRVAAHNRPIEALVSRHVFGAIYAAFCAHTEALDLRSRCRNQVKDAAQRAFAEWLHPQAALEGKQVQSLHAQARKEERARQARTHVLIGTFFRIFPQLGMEALRLPEVEEDPWLAREAWKLAMKKWHQVEVQGFRRKGEQVRVFQPVLYIQDEVAAMDRLNWMIQQKHQQETDSGTGTKQKLGYP